MSILAKIAEIENEVSDVRQPAGQLNESVTFSYTLTAS